jgi:hypothetical protein
MSSKFDGKPWLKVVNSSRIGHNWITYDRVVGSGTSEKYRA